MNAYISPNLIHRGKQRLETPLQLIIAVHFPPFRPRYGPSEQWRRRRWTWPHALSANLLLRLSLFFLVSRAVMLTACTPRLQHQLSTMPRF